MDLVNRELELHDPLLGSRPQIIAFNKIDLPEAQANLPRLQGALRDRGIESRAISVATGEHVRELVVEVAHLLDSVRNPQGQGWTEEAGRPAAAPTPTQPEAEDALPVIRPAPQRRFSVEKLGDGLYQVEGRRLAVMAEMLNLSQDEAKAEFFRRLTRFGVVSALRRAGVRPGDHVRFGATEIRWDEY
jgi:GTP-binding protein